MPGFGEHRRMVASWERFGALERVPGDGRAVLTFDDGPDPDATPAVLDALEAAGARATFFLVGEQLMRHPRLGRELVRRGHEAALHCFCHERHTRLRPQAVRDDLARGLGAIEAATGVRPRLFRPPYGELAEASGAACADLGLRPVGWSAWGADWETIAPARIADLVGRDLEDGAVVLLHDSARYAPRESAAATAAAVPLVAALARERGLALEPLGASLEAP